MKILLAALFSINTLAACSQMPNTQALQPTLIPSHVMAIQQAKLQQIKVTSLKLTKNKIVMTYQTVRGNRTVTKDLDITLDNQNNPIQSTLKVDGYEINKKLMPPATLKTYQDELGYIVDKLKTLKDSKGRSLQFWQLVVFTPEVIAALMSAYGVLGAIVWATCRFKNTEEGLIIDCVKKEKVK
jgi:hypothetical protein